MEFANPRGAARSAIGFALLACGALLLLPNGWIGAHGSSQTADAASGRNLEFLHSAAGIDGRIHLLRHFEKQMLAHAALPEKAAHYRHKRDEARQRIDELMLRASAAAGNGEERRRLEQLAERTRRADLRFAQIDQSFFQPNGENQ